MMIRLRAERGLSQRVDKYTRVGDFIFVSRAVDDVLFFFRAVSVSFEFLVAVLHVYYYRMRIKFFLESSIKASNSEKSLGRYLVAVVSLAFDVVARSIRAPCQLLGHLPLILWSVSSRVALASYDPLLSLANVPC